MDFFFEVGELGLGSRLRRLSDRLMQEGAHIYQDAGIEFKPAWFPTFAFLLKQGPTPVGQLATELGVTHVAINQILEELTAKGLVQSEAGVQDKRVRLARLTDRGIALAEEVTPVWDAIRAAIGSAITESGYDLMSSISRLETCLDRKGFRDRFSEQWGNRVEILPFQPEYASAFWDINSAWIEEHFVMEEIDRRILQHPQQEILDKGGEILFARDLRTGEILGTCALIEHGGKWELAKMGVRPSARGRGIAEKLGKATIACAKSKGISKLVLETNSSLIPAINLYRKLGFQRVKPNEASDYARSDVVMELDIQ